MAEEKAELSGFAITIQADDEYILVPGEHGIVGTKGIFIRDHQLGAGTPAVVHKDWTPGHFRSGKLWHIRNNLAMSVCVLQVSKSFRISEANPRRELRDELFFIAAISPRFAANYGARNEGERIDHPIA